MSIKLIKKYTLISLLFFSFIYVTIALGDPIKIMSYNLGNPEADMDHMVTWEYRYGLVTDIINQQDPDIIGLQEVRLQANDQQLNYLLESYRGVYTFLIVPINDPTGNTPRSHNVIMFKAKRFNELNSGTLEHTEGNETIRRTPVWVTLEDTYQNNINLTFISAHLDPGDWTGYKDESARVMRRFAAEQDNPVVAVGDFNCQPSGSPITIMTKEDSGSKLFNDLLCYSNDTSQCSKPTFHRGTKLDYIFGTQDITYSDISNPYVVGNTKQEVVAGNGDTRWTLPSDHFAVGVSITLQEQ